ncbi:MAG: YdcF family protein [Anaerolineales bacterium]|nr:YdcF family protein [Anaerolineales bacterium]
MILRLVYYLLLCGALLLLIPRLITLLSGLTRVYTVEKVPAGRVAVVFGAGLWRDGSPTPVLRDRVETAVSLYEHGKVEKLLMSGDNRFVDYNEPEAMRQYALKLGVPEKDIIADYAGRRTYDTCYRVREIFQADNVILVTQKFHLHRALFTCNALGVNANGVAAENRYYRKVSRAYWNVRELFATLSAFWDVYLKKPVPVLGDPEPIFPEDNIIRR